MKKNIPIPPLAQQPQANTQRPQRMQYANFSGKKITLQDGPTAYLCLNAKAQSAQSTHVLLGSGPLLVHPCAPPALLHNEATVYVIHSPTFLENMRTPSLRKGTEDAVAKDISPTSSLGYETPAFSSNTVSYPASWQERLPAHWHSLMAQDFLSFLQNNKNVAFWWYVQNMELDSDFWLPLLGQSHAHLLSAKTQCVNFAKKTPTKQLPQKPFVVLGSSPDKLLYQELYSAFTELGYAVHPCTQDLHTLSPEDREKILASCALFFSVNLQGLDAGGHDFALLQALGIPVALWFVDNPWHVLASLRLPWWKKATLFVTDASFIKPLHQEGAENIFHLPLAVAQHMWEASKTIHTQHTNITEKTIPQYRNRNSNNETSSLVFAKALSATQQAGCIFVGRAAFPHKQSFFAAAKVPQELLQEAYALLDNTGAQQEIPHFQWWAKRLAHGIVRDAALHGINVQKSKSKESVKNTTAITGDISTPSLFWPGHEVRRIGLGAEQCAQRQRVQWLTALLPCHPAIFGDADLWQTLLPASKTTYFLPAVDYYTELATLYAAAPCVLNVTSLLLPWGLTQRHFDVWAAGGFLWTNTTHGLDIFPQSLTKAISLDGPHKLEAAIKGITPQIKEELQAGWREILQEKHQYTQRMAWVLERVL